MKTLSDTTPQNRAPARPAEQYAALCICAGALLGLFVIYNTIAPEPASSLASYTQQLLKLQGCEDVPVQSDQIDLQHGHYTIKIQHCGASPNRCAGFFIIWVNDVNGTGVLNLNPIFRIRLVGPEVQLATVTNTTRTVGLGQGFVAPYEMTLAGNYSVEILLLYKDFDASDIVGSIRGSLSAAIVSKYLFNCTFNLSSSAAAVNTTMKCSKARDEVHTKGFWTVTDPSLLQYLKCTRYQPIHKHTKAFRCPEWPKNQHNILGTKPNAGYGLKYNKFCGINKDYSQDAAAVNTCFQRINLCTFGDSQMRHLHYTILTIRKMSSGVGPDFNFFKPLPYKQMLNSTYEIKRYTSIGTNLTETFQGCTHVVLNFGQWPASHDYGYPWSFEMYEAAVKADLQYIKEFYTFIDKNHAPKFIWMTTNPNGFGSWAWSGRDWRTDAVLDRYNDIATTLARLHNFTIFDSYDIIKPLEDLAYDFMHYVGAVGFAVGNAFLNSICNDVLNITYSY